MYCHVSIVVSITARTRNGIAYRNNFSSSFFFFTIFSSLLKSWQTRASCWVQKRGVRVHYTRFVGSLSRLPVFKYRN